MACGALQEPSFHARNWNGVLRLFFMIAQERIRLSGPLQKQLETSDDEMYHILWEHTLSMLIAVEEKVNQDGDQKMRASGSRGILDYDKNYYAHPLINLESHNLSTITFIDNLARQRDRLWSILRLRFHPAAAALPMPFPRELPFQLLTAP